MMTPRHGIAAIVIDSDGFEASKVLIGIVADL